MIPPFFLCCPVDKTNFLFYNGMEGMNMEKKVKVWWGTTIVLTLYTVVAIPVFLSQGSSLEGHPIFGALYLWAVTAHGVLLGLALLFQWIGVGKSLRWSLRTGFFFTLLGMLELALLVYPLVILLPVLLVELFVPYPKK